MRTKILLAWTAMLLMGGAGAASAQVPFFNANCATDIDVHADEGGPVYVNGTEAELKRFNDNYYEARSGRTTISISVNPDGSVAVSYTGKRGANGICQVNAHQKSGRKVAPPRAEPDSSHYEGLDAAAMPRYCQGEVAAKFNVSPRDVTTNMAFRIGARFVVQGWFEGDRGTTFFNCYFDQSGNFVSVN